MKNKNIVSLSLSLAFSALSISGLLLYLVKHNKTTTSIHVVFGLLFLCFALVHIFNNWSSLISYAKSKTNSTIQKEFILSFVVVGIFLAGTWLKIPPFGEIESLGEKIRTSGGGERKRDARVMFLELEGKKEKGNEATIIIQKNKKAVLPTIAIWVEDSTRAFVENLFVPAKTISVKNGKEDIQEAVREGEVEIKALDASVLPTWSAKAKDQHATFENPTPNDDFIWKTKIAASGSYFVLIEVKTKDKIEVYEAIVNPLKEKVFSFKSKRGTILTRAILEIN